MTTTTTGQTFRLRGEVRWWGKRWTTIYAANGRTVLGELHSTDGGRTWTATSLDGRAVRFNGTNPYRAAAALLVAIAG